MQMLCVSETSCKGKIFKSQSRSQQAFLVIPELIPSWSRSFWLHHTCIDAAWEVLLHLLLKMALSSLALFSHTLHTDLGYTIFFLKFFCSAKHNCKVRNCFSADTCGSASHFVSRWVVMKSGLLISFSEASSPESKEVNYRAVGEKKKMQIPRLMVFPSRKNGQVDVKQKNLEIMF